MPEEDDGSCMFLRLFCVRSVGRLMNQFTYKAKIEI